jgi:hypothetical protein
MSVLCIDLEASSLGPNGFPIEVAVAAVATGAVSSWLIQPPRLWIERGTWDDDAEALHGLSLAQLLAEGLAPNKIIAELSGLLWGAVVLSDNMRHDSGWLRALYSAAGVASIPTEIESFQDYATALATTLVDPQATGAAETWASTLIPTRHRAGPDAQRNAAILRRLSGLPEHPASQG